MDSRWIKVDYILILQGTVMEKYVYQFFIYACRIIPIYKYSIYLTRCNMAIRNLLR